MKGLEESKKNNKQEVGDTDNEEEDAPSVKVCVLRTEFLFVLDNFAFLFEKPLPSCLLMVGLGFLGWWEEW